jgi:AI-2 transport protein TqsA
LGDVDINANNGSISARILIYSTAAVLLTIGMQAISTILVPVFSIFAYLIFAPLVRWLMGKKVQKEIEDQQTHLSRFAELSRTVISYMLLRTETNLVGGIGAAILLLLGGMDFAVLWDILFFLFGYISYLGFFLLVLHSVIDNKDGLVFGLKEM